MKSQLTIGRSSVKHSLPLLAAALLTGCGGGSDSTQADTSQPLTVPRVTACANGDSPEEGLQGQVPAALRQSFRGFNCNLKLLGQVAGEGGSWSQATFEDSAGHKCSYHSTASPVPGRQNPGVPVIDVTNPAQPVRTMSLTTTAMLDPWESLRINTRRQILVADQGTNNAGGPNFDIYDLSGDCRFPQLRASTVLGAGTDGGIPATPSVVAGASGVMGHEGSFAPDGLTYYVGDVTNRTYHAIDITNTTAPKLIASFDMKKLAGGAHGLSISQDGSRLYGVSTITDSTTGKASNGFLVFDTSEVQQRKPNATIKLISRTLSNDATAPQHTIPIKIKGKDYVVLVNEGGGGGLPDLTGASVKNACAIGASPFPMARIYDLADETQPTLVSKLLLETHDPANCEKILPDLVGLGLFTYGSHYCTVDNRQNATALACSYFNSGIRVFDIREPSRPKEIAYFNPPGMLTKQLGSNHVSTGQWRPGGPDWCSARLDFDHAKRQLITSCQDNGLLVMQFAPGVWPFVDSTPSRDAS
jgi:hypothetical protein